MALRIRKNSVSPQAPPANPGGEQSPAPPQDFGEFSNIPSESVDSPPPDAPASRTGLPLKTPKKKPPVVLLGGLGALLVVAVGAGVANFLTAGHTPDEIPAPPPVVRAPRPAPGAAPQAAPAPGAHNPPGAPGHIAHPAAAAAAKVTGHTPATSPGATGSPAQALPKAAAGHATAAAAAGHAKMPAAKPAGSAAKAAATRPATPKGSPVQHSTPSSAKPEAVIAPIVTPKPPRAVVHPVIAPVSGGTPGQRDVPGSVRMVTRHMAPNSPLFLQLQQLWTRGRIAKQSNDFAAARSAWQKGLALASADPAAAQSARGFRESLAKLPK